jgi:hypothetical protein
LNAMELAVRATRLPITQGRSNIVPKTVMSRRDNKRLVAQLPVSRPKDSRVVMEKRNKSQDYDRSVRYRNVERYHRLLRTVVDEGRRRFLLGLLAEELQKQKDAGDSKYQY